MPLHNETTAAMAVGDGGSPPERERTAAIDAAARYVAETLPAERPSLVQLSKQCSH